MNLSKKNYWSYILEKKKDKKPDNVADNPAILPYGSNVGAPAIKPTDINSWKNERIVSTNHYFETRYNEIKEEYIKSMNGINSCIMLSIVFNQF